MYNLTQCFQVDAGIPAVQMVITTSVMVTTLAFWARAQTSLPGHTWFFYGNLAMIWWLISIGVEISTPVLTCKIAWAQLAWLGVILLPTFWCFFLYEYTSSRQVPRAVVKLAVAFMPIVLLSLILTNTFHGQLYGPDTKLVVRPTGTYAHFDHQPLFYVVIGYLYLVILGTTITAGLAMWKANPAVRSFFVKLFLTTMIPIVANVLYIFFDVMWFDSDPTPFSFVASLTLVVWLIADNRWVDVSAIARDMLFYKSDDVVLLIDLEGNLLEANAAAHDALLLSNGQPTTGLEGIGPIIDTLIETEKLPDEPEAKCNNRHYVARAYPIRLGKGQRLLGWTVSFVDVTVQTQAAERARAAERVQTQFLATVSHELRTPLTVVNGALGMLKGRVTEIPPETINHLVGLAAKNTTILASLLNDLLDTQKLESSEFTLNFAAVNVDDIVADAVGSMETFNATRNIKIRYQGSARPAVADVDESRLHQVLVNVLSNASKFSPDNSYVDVALDTRLDTAVITVTDRGRGIPAGSEEKVFGRFTQVDETDHKDVYGSGLGMHIAKQILSKHHGSISYESELGVGTTFTITLPLSGAHVRAA